MLKNSLFRKCISLVLTIALLTSVVAPASAAAADFLSGSLYDAYYVALGDAVTEGYGLEDPDDVYYVKVAEALGKPDDYFAFSHNKLRVEEIRYLLDDKYVGDGYTNAIGSMLKHKRAEVQGYVSNANVISVNAGVRNFSTYIVEQMVYYLENKGAVKYDYSFDAFYDENVQDALDDIKNVVMEQFAAVAPDDGVKALEFTQFLTEVSAYAMMSYVTSFNGMISSIYALNPDVELYIIGVYNPTQGDVLSYSNGEKTVTIPLGTFLGALVELANTYAQVLAPRAYDYTYVDPGEPELLIDQMANKNLTDDERFPNGLMAELLDLAGDAALEEVIDIFTDYEIDPSPLTMEKYAERFLDELAYITDPDERIAYVQNEISVQASKKVRDAFKTELKNYLGQFADGDAVIDDTAIENLLNDLGGAAVVACANGDCSGDPDQWCRSCIAKAFVEDMINDPELQKQAAAKLIYDKLADYGLKDCITLESIEQMLTDMNNCGDNENAREAVVVAFVHDLAVAKVTQYIQQIVGEKNYTEAKADAMLTAMENAANKTAATAIAKEALWKDAFKQYLVEKITVKFAENDLEWVNTTAAQFADDIYAAGDNYENVVRATVRASAAKMVADQTMGVFTTEEIIDIFAAMDAKSTKAEKDAALQAELGVLYGLVGEVAWTAYDKYTDAANTSISLVGQYLDGVEQAAEALADYNGIQETVIGNILQMYKDNYKNGALDLGGLLEGNDGLKELQDLREAAVDAILDGYSKYEDALDTAMKGAEQINAELTPVYDMLKRIAEIEQISLNDLLTIGRNVVGNKSYVTDLANRLVLDKTLNPEEYTAAYLALRYFVGNGMMIMPSAKGHKTIADQIIKAINGESTNSLGGVLGNKVVDGLLDIYHCSNTGSGQAETLINPDTYIAFGDDVTMGTALNAGEKTYVELLADALAMEYKDDADFDSDVILDLSFGGMRAEELHALVDANYNGDAYTNARYSAEKLASLREQYLTNIQNADLITINVGINNLVTFPLMQTYLAYNGEETYEMDWAYYLGQKRADKITTGKAALNKLLMHTIDVADNHIETIDGTTVYQKCEYALNTAVTAFESLAYGLLGYMVNLDAAVEAITAANTDATIVLVGFYNPMEDTYIDVESVTLGSKVVDLSEHMPINTSALTDKVINLSNRFLTNYVGDIRGNETAADEGSRLVTVSVLDTELCVSDTNASKDLSALVDWTTVSGLGKEVTIKIPKYLMETRKTMGETLHPNADGHAYIFNQILKALEYEIHADVVTEDNEKFYGDADPELIYNWDDISSLFEDGTVVNVSRAPGEDVGQYAITATVEKNGGYYEIDLFDAVFTIKARPITVEVKESTAIVTGDALPGFTAVITDVLTGEEIENNGIVEITGIPADSNTAGEYTIGATLANTNYVLAEEVKPATLIIEEKIKLDITLGGVLSDIYGAEHQNNLETVVTVEGNEVDIPGLTVTFTAPALDAATGTYTITPVVDAVPYGYEVASVTSVEYTVTKRPISLDVTVLDNNQITAIDITTGSLLSGEDLDMLGISLVNGVVVYDNENYDVAINVISETTPRDVYIKIQPSEGISYYYGDVIVPYYKVLDVWTGEEVDVDLQAVLDTTAIDTSILGEHTVKVLSYVPVAGYNVDDIANSDASFRVEPRPITVDVTVVDGVISNVVVTDGELAFEETTDALNLFVAGDAVICNNGNYNVTVNATFETTEVIQIGDVLMGNQSLELADEVHYKFEFTLKNFNLDQIEEIGLLRFYTKFGDPYATRDTDLANTIFDQADEKFTWTMADVETSGSKYVARTNGIPAKNLGDDTWFRAYVKLKDGSYCYSLRYVYDAVRYAQKAVSKYPTDTGLHAVCAAMLNYGTAAQKYFEYKTNDLMNAILDTDLSSIKSLVADYDASMITDRLPARTSPYGEFDIKSGKITTGQYNLSLLGAISLNAYSWKYKTAGVTEAGFFVWEHDTFAAGETLTQDNADYKLVADSIDGTIEGSIIGIAAADMCDTFAVAPYIVINGEYYYCGVSRISVDYYADKVITDAKGTYTELHKDVAKFMVVYGEYAEAYFR